MLDGLAEFAAIVSPEGTILLTNPQWNRELDKRGTSAFRTGCNYPGNLAALVEAGDARVKPILDAFHDIGAGTRRSFRCAYFGSGVFAGHDYRIRLSSFRVVDGEYVLVSVEDVTEVSSLKRQRRRFDSGVLKAQESERRRIARELHDSTSQELVVLQLHLTHLDNMGSPEGRQIVSECREVLKNIQRQIRSLSFMAHPPEVSLYGLAPALERLAQGFASRVGLNVDLQIADVGEACASVEAAIFRLAQEALSNIHRHASASSAGVRLVGTNRCLHLVISDDGVGLEEVKLHGNVPVGVGILGMNDRIRELGGRFSMRRIDDRTVISASLPRWKADLVR